jgi:hypothetical protein
MDGYVWNASDWHRYERKRKPQQQQPQQQPVTMMKDDSMCLEVKDSASGKN